MKHCRLDYEIIQPDPNAETHVHIADDEPVFILRAKDVVGPRVVRVWAEFARMAGADQNLTERVDRWADEMDAWAEKNGRKVPDTPPELLRP